MIIENEFDPSDVIASVLIDRKGNIHVEPVGKGLVTEQSDLRSSEKTASRVLWFDVFEKNPTIVRIYYMTIGGDKKYIDVEVP